MKKILISLVTMLFTASCNFVTQTQNDEVKPDFDIVKADFKIKQDAQPQPQMLTFESKVVNQPLQTVFKLPEKDGIELSFITKPEKDYKKKIKIPLNGKFQVIFEKASTVSKKKDDDDKKATIIDNDATDGTATIQLPESIMEGFIKVKNENEDDDKKSNQSKLIVEDKLYYSKTELNVLKPNEKKEKDDKEKWYRLGSKIFPVPEDFHSDDGSKYILRFENTGTKNFAMKWYKSRKFDYPVGTVEITPEKGGVVELQGVGRLEIPAGAVDKPTIVKMVQELNAPEIFVSGNGYYSNDRDYLSSVVKLEPFGLKLNKPAKIHLETDKARLGNNSYKVIDWYESKDKVLWQGIMDTLVDNFFDDPNNLKDSFMVTLNELGYISKQIEKFMKPDSNYNNIRAYDTNYSDFSSSFDTKANPQIKNYPTKNFSINYPETYTLSNGTNLDSSIIKKYYTNAGAILENAYAYFSDKTGFNRIYLIKINMNFDKIFDNMAATSKAQMDINLLDKNNNVLKNTSQIEIGRFSHGADHELWHVFQNFRYASSIGQNFNKSFDPYGWMWESSAQYMGARARNQSNPKINDADVRDFCNPSLKYEYDDLANKHILSPDLATSTLPNGDLVNYGN